MALFDYINPFKGVSTSKPASLLRPAMGLGIVPGGLPGVAAHEILSNQARKNQALWDTPMGTPPAIPDYQAGPTSNLAQSMQARLSGVQADPRGLEAFRGEALRGAGTPSAYARAASSQARAVSAQERDRANQTGRATQAEALSNLAQSGGLSSGARERVLQRTPQGLLSAQQNVGAAEQQALLGIRAQDESNRMRQLEALPGMEIQQLDPAFKKATLLGQAEESDVERAAREAQMRNQYNLGTYGIRAGIYGGEELAKAQRAAGRGGLFQNLFG